MAFVIQNRARKSLAKSTMRHLQKKIQRAYQPLWASKAPVSSSKQCQGSPEEGRGFARWERQVIFIQRTKSSLRILKRMAIGRNQENMQLEERLVERVEVKATLTYFRVQFMTVQNRSIHCATQTDGEWDQLRGSYPRSNCSILDTSCIFLKIL